MSFDRRPLGADEIGPTAFGARRVEPVAFGTVNFDLS